LTHNYASDILGCVKSKFLSWVFSERYSSRTDLEAETREAIAEVLESGFLSAQIIFTPDPLSIACFSLG
jgi:hypothetical protein